ncbi:MAG: 2-amino-4-hydroxy-6-hydroxymethyldihydropteridine diphosphokinase [Candidatus Omnitrophica bacterium]|nr:2-amino-4-hydroxy-6-hydroxymethyldihydropteridine diphosphokinase [Candidatus Omnitrophota bacterium]
MAICYIGIGSNLGDREKNIKGSIRRMNRVDGISALKRSSIYETEPQGGPPQGKFLNACVKIRARLKPQDLLKALKSIEREMGRRKTARFGPRIIDLDILLYGNEKISRRGLKIPHPRMLERDFVLMPLKEIAPKIKI